MTENIPEKLREMAQALREKNASIEKEKMEKVALALTATRGLKRLEQILQGGNNER